MEKQPCSIHKGRNIVSVCLHKDCGQTFLCLHCMTNHPEDHMDDIMEIDNLISNQNWVEDYEKERDNLISEEESMENSKQNLIFQYKSLLEGMIKKVMKSLEEKQEMLIGELVTFMDNSNQQEGKELSSKIKDNLQ